MAVSEYPTEFFVFPVQNSGFRPPAFLLSEKAAAAIRPPAVVKTLEQRRGELSDEHRAALSEMRAAVEAQTWHDASFHTDWVLLRYLGARGFNVKKALTMLEKTMAWRKERNPDTFVCRVCREDPNKHMMGFVGWDLQHRPVMYSSFRWATDRTDPERSLLHCVETFRHMERLMPEGVEQWVGMTDFQTYSHFSDGNPRMGSAVISALQDHFPERLGLQVLIDPPTMFWILWKCLSPFIDSRTKEKVRFVYTNAKPNISDEFPTIFPPHLAEYLEDTYRRNKIFD